jgi:hypothetical protein
MAPLWEQYSVRGDQSRRPGCLWPRGRCPGRDKALSGTLSEPLRDSILPDTSPACPGEKPQISPLRSPGFPVEVGGFDQSHAVFLGKKPHAWSLPAARSRKFGYAPVEMTKGHPLKDSSGAPSQARLASTWRIAEPAPRRSASFISEYLRERITPSAPP